MFDHTRFLATVPPETRDVLTRRVNAPAIIHATLHFALIAGLGAWIGYTLPGWPLAIPLLGITMAFLFTLQHECTHKTPFRTAWVNDAVGHLCGLILIQPFHWFRAFHMAHHRYTNDPERDPELSAPKPATRRDIAWHLLGIGYWRDKLKVLAGNAAGPADAPYLSPRQHAHIRWEARLMGVVYVGAALIAGYWLFWLWLLPLAFGFPVLRLYLLAEHGLCSPVANMFENTRTTLTNRVVRWLSWNMPYHAEHHAWPAVPYHALPALHSLSAPHLQRVSDSYRAFTSEYLTSNTESTGAQTRETP